MTLGEFLQQIIEWIYDLWPFRIIRQWEQGVRLRLGNVSGLLTSTNGWFGTGLHGFWPLIGEIISDETNTQVIDTDWQTLDDISWSLAARFKVFDLAKLYILCQEQDDSIKNIIQAAALEWAYLLTDDEVDDEAFGKAVKKAASVRLKKWGVTLLEVKLMNRVEAKALRLLSDGGE